MSHISGQGQHRSMSSNGNHIALIVAFVVALAVALGLGVWFAAMHNDSTDVSRPGTSTVADTSLDKSGSVPQPVAEHHGNPDDGLAGVSHRGRIGDICSQMVLPVSPTAVAFAIYVPNPFAVSVVCP